MPIRTQLNNEYIANELVWLCRLSLLELNERAGLSRGYIYRLIGNGDDDGVGITTATIDKIYNAAVERLAEINIAPPDNLWQLLIIHNYD